MFFCFFSTLQQVTLKQLLHKRNTFSYSVSSKLGVVCVSFTSHSCILYPSSLSSLHGGRGILMLSQTMDNLGDFLCASVIWFCPEAALLQSLLSGRPEPWKSDFPLSLLAFSCGLCERAESTAIVVWFSDFTHWILWLRAWRAVLTVYVIPAASSFTGIVSPHRKDLCIVGNNSFC